MRRGWLALGSGLGISALWRRRSKSRLGGPGPADELRAKLAESRTGATSAEQAPASSAPALGADEPIAPPDEASPLDPEVRRRSIHERTREAMEELGSDEDQA